MQIAAAFVEIRARQDQLEKDLADVERKVEGSAKSTAGKWASVFGTVAVGAGIKKLIDSASDLEQAVGGTAAVFGDARGEIDSFAKGAATSAGLSERAARELTSQLGGLLSGFGFTKKEAAALSIELTKLGGDLSATFGGKPEEAVQALGAAMRGETDPIERYGISLNQAAVNAKAVELGLASSTSTVDANAKAQATLAIITEKSAGAQGQFAREADSAAGKAAITAAKTENAAASMGDSLLPIYSKAVSVIGSVADAFAQLPDGVQTGVIALLAVAAVAPRVVDGAKAIKAGWEAAGSGATSLAGKVATLNPALGLAGVAAGVAGLAVWANSLNRTEVDVEALVRATGKLDSANREELAKVIVVASEFGKLDDTVRKVAESNVVAAERLIDMAEASGHSKDEIAKLREITDGKRESDIQGSKDQAAYTESVEEGTQASKEAADALEEQRVKLDELTQAVLAAFDSNLGYRQSVDSTSDAVRALSDTTKEHGRASEEYSDQLLDTEQRLLSQAGAAVKLADDQAKAAGATLSAKDKAQIYKDELIKLQGQFPELAALIQGYIDKLNNIPTEIRTQLITEESKVQRNKVQSSKDREHAALGGGFGTGAEVEVGEAGREVVQFGQPGTVIPNFDLGGRGGITVQQMTVMVDSPREFYDETLWRVAG